MWGVKDRNQAAQVGDGNAADVQNLNGQGHEQPD